MSDTASFTDSELLCVMAARRLADGVVVFAGVGLPLLSVTLAQRTHAPNLTMVVEGGEIGCEVVPGRLPISTNEMRLAHRATMLPGITDTFHFAQRGYVDVAFMGGAQIDQYGNVNTSVIGPFDHPKVRLPGSGGGNDIASLCRELVIVTMHEKRRFLPRVDFITSPGWVGPGDARRAAGLRFGGVSQVITNLGLFGFDPATRTMRLDALHPGITVDAVRANTGFEVLISPTVAVTEPPTERELAVLRSLDADRRFLG
jgi:glutaconate CoA-transferase, subunit B